MGKYTGTLHKLIESACVSNNSKKKWDQVVHYLEGHTVPNARAEPPEFESPLPPDVVCSPDLDCELFDPQGPKKEDTPLKIAVKAAPAKVIAALCQLGPEAVSLVDGRHRLPIHWACRRSSDDPETDKVMEILIASYPESLLHRDDGGRTPLHWLFWYHAKTRTPAIVQTMCQELPPDWFDDIRQPRTKGKEQFPLPEIQQPSTKKEIPSNAAILCDAKHGVLPLHYAVMQGASREALKTLIRMYPRSIAVVDRKGRSALAWYLGAGSLMDAKKHVCGEPNDPNATPFWHTKLSLQYVQMLISSKVARLSDDRNRTPLHWACHFFARNAAAGSEVSSKGGPSISNKIFQMLLDNNISSVTHQDIEGQTPLHVMFSVVSDVQESEYQRLVANRSLRHEVDLTVGGPVAFSPPKPLVELLLKSPEVDGQDFFSEDGGHGTTAAHLEDENGLLPLHKALRCATSIECIQLLIQTNPTSLVHTSEEQMQTPLIHAYCSEVSAPLQPAKALEILMAAYVTSRHGTFMDGRLALKMEDANGKFPIHYACQNQASFETIKLFVEKFNRCAIYQNADGELPVHSLLSKEYLFVSSESGVVRGASLAKPLGLLSEQELQRQNEINQVMKAKIRLLLEPLNLPEHLKIAPSAAHAMTPLHIAVAFNALPYARIYRMVDTYPESARMFATEVGHQYSCLELHDKLKDRLDDAEEWQAIREMLYSFNPSLETHRNDEELLDACVKLIRNEMLGNGSFHLQQLKEHRLKAPAKIDLMETLSAINAPELESVRRARKGRGKKLSTPAVPVRRQQDEEVVSADDIQLSASSSFTSMLAKNLEQKESMASKKTMYDSELDDRYVVSPQNSADNEDDDDEFDESSAEEEYYSDGDSETNEGSRNIERLESASWDEDNMESASISESISQSLSQTLSSVVDSVSYRSTSRSLLRKAIAESVSEEMKKPAIFEEKKSDDQDATLVTDINVHLSDVAARLWCFFVAYNNPKDPQDNYLPQVKAVLEDVDFDTISQLIDLEAPSYAVEYMEPGVSHLGLTMRDIASPKVKELFESHYYFLGRFEFQSDLDGIVIHRSADNDTLWIRATEHVVQTSEYEAPKVVDPGLSEESIWKTGEVLHDEEGYMASRFKDNNRQVYFKFSRNKTVYENEVKSRADVGMTLGEESHAHLLPLLDCFDVSGDKSTDRRYLMDVNDERFKTVHTYGGERIRLSDFPFASVHPYCEGGDLLDYFYHHGVRSMSQVSNIASQVCKAVKSMHDNKLILANLSMRSFVVSPSNDTEGENSEISWVLSDLSGVCRNHQSAYMAAISSDGSAQFETGLMPPEMFTKLSQSEEDVCKEYWDKVEEVYGVKVNRKIIEPIVDTHSGCSYTLRCHYAPNGRRKIGGEELPELPYMLVPARQSTDIWCFGLMLFCMCSEGRPLFPTNLRSGHLLEHDIVNWNKDTARARVYEYVSDPVAQDILLQLLSSYETRNTLDFDSIMSHPFFSKETSPKALVKLVEKRQNDCAAYMRNRNLVVNEKSEDDWLTSRTTIVNCWNFDELKKFHFSCSEIVRRLTGKENGMPSSFLLLPYKLSAKNKKAKLAPTTKKDVERAERMGVLLLALAKACHFGVLIEQTVEQDDSQKKWDAVTLLESVNLPSDHYEDLKEEFAKLAADRIEAFRSDPTSAVTKLIERRYFEIRSFFKDTGKAFLYLVDEYMGVPAVGPAFEPYPLEISESAMSKMLAKVLPFMHCSSMCVRGIAGSVSGIVRLIFEAAYPHVPPSWATAASGLDHVLDEDLIQKEVLILHRTLSGLNNSKSRRSLSDDLGFIRETCSKADVKGDFGSMRRAQCSGDSVWTTQHGLETIQDACKNYDFKQALAIQAQLESKLKSQDDLISQLRDKIEWLAFRKELNLKTPAESSLSTHSASVTRKMENTGHNSSSSRSTQVAGTPTRKHTNAVDGASPNKSLVGTLATEKNASRETPQDEQQHPDDGSTIASGGSKSTFREHIGNLD
ncbi:MAG: hypothetical protein SGILL_001758 [Bacillariaceae sp.]